MNQGLRLAEWVQQLTGLVFLAGCVAMVTPSPGPKINLLPSVEKPRKRNLPPEVQEFMKLPPHIQKQVLDYARNWIGANFERAG
jgi:hypothetical protein